jgi:HD-like signal output (HDOD) protein
MSSFRDQLTAKLSILEDLPTLPSIIITLERLLHDETVAMEEVALVIEEDPAIAGSVLRVANSVMYYSSLSGTIVSVRDAIVRLGLKEVGRLVSTAAFIRTFGKLGPHWDPGRFWRHSLRTAVAARVIGRSATVPVSFYEDEAYMAGLLHDVGWLILDQYFPDAYDRLQTTMEKQGLAKADDERAVLGLDHGEIGGCLLDLWNLPEVLVEAVAWHNQPDRAKPEARLLAEAVQVSEIITEALKGGDDSEELMQTMLGQELWGKLGISREGVAAVVDETRGQSTPVFALV